MEEGNLPQGDAFWAILQQETGIILPDAVKRVLEFHDLKDPVTFGDVNSETIAAVELHAKTKLMDLIEDDDLKLYYHIYYKKAENFEFSFGERSKIKKLVECVKSKSVDFWRPKKQRVLIEAPSEAAFVFFT